MKKTLLFLAFILSTFSFAQTNGITYQAVIYSANGESVPGINNANAPLANRKICLQFSIVDDYSQTEYQEKVIVTTDDYGMVNLIIGTGTQTGGYANSFETIVWNSAKKYLKVSLDQSGNCNSFDEISNQVLSYVPFALAANSASSVSGIVGIVNGGTNASTVLGAKTNLQLQNVDNTSDLNKPLSTATQTALNSKVDKVAGKDLSTEDYTTDEKTKLAAISGVNTGDQDLSSFATTTDLNLKVDKVTGKDLSSNDFTTAEKTKLAAISGTNTGDQDLSSFATTSSVNEALNNKFVDLTTNQTIAGKKTFNADMDVNGDLKVIGVISNPTVMLENSAIETGTWGADQWQSFTATASGILNKISIFGNGLIGDRTGTLTIYAGTGTSGTQLYSGSTALPPSSGWFDLAINSNLKIEIGQVYSFRIEDQNSVISPGGMVASINNRYTQGDYYSSVYGANSNYDLNFKLWVGTLTGGSLLANGASFNEEVIASGFKIPSGTSSQYLMADGSTSTLNLNNSVPYTGASSAVNLGAFDLTVNGLTIGKGTGQNDQNTAIGSGALYSSGANGTRNTAVGYLALKDYRGTSFDNNTGVGYFNMIGLTTGYGNTSIGAETMFNLGAASNNTGIGNQSLINAAGDNNVGVGARSGDGLTTGTNNTFLGTQARTLGSSSTISNSTALGYDAVVSTNNTIQLGNTAITDVKTNGAITATKFKIPNGTASQFLMADGSVSSSSTGSSSQWTTSNDDIYYTAGKVGIGLSNPGNGFNTNLDVAGRSSFRINSSTNALIMDGSTGFSRIYTDATSGSPDDLILGTYPNGHMKQVFLKQSNGYVGINNDNPSEQLDVTGSIKATGFKTPTGTSSQYLMADGSVSDTSSYGNNVFNTVSTPIESLNNFNVSQVGILIVTGIYDSTLNFYGLEGGVKGQIVYLINNCSSSSGYLQALQAVPNSILAIQKFKSKDPNNNSTYISNRTATLIYDGEFWHVLTGGY